MVALYVGLLFFISLDMLLQRIDLLHGSHNDVSCFWVFELKKFLDRCSSEIIIALRRLWDKCKTHFIAVFLKLKTKIFQKPEQQLIQVAIRSVTGGLCDQLHYQKTLQKVSSRTDHSAVLSWKLNTDAAWSSLPTRLDWVGCFKISWDMFILLAWSSSLAARKWRFLKRWQYVLGLRVFLLSISWILWLILFVWRSSIC